MICKQAENGDRTRREITVQFSNATGKREQLYNLQRLVGADAIESMQQVFPGDDDPRLAAIVVATISPSVSLNQAVESLNADDEVRIAHLAAQRMPQESDGGGRS